MGDPNEKSCANCNGDHPVWDQNCPKRRYRQRLNEAKAGMAYTDAEIERHLSQPESVWDKRTPPREKVDPPFNGWPKPHKKSGPGEGGRDTNLRGADAGLAPEQKLSQEERMRRLEDLVEKQAATIDNLQHMLGNLATAAKSNGKLLESLTKNFNSLALNNGGRN